MKTANVFITPHIQSSNLYRFTLKSLRHFFIHGKLLIFRRRGLSTHVYKLRSEDEQFAVYKKVAEAFKGKPVKIRTLDMGGDKDIGCLHFPVETNPFLGWRGIRFTLDNQEIFKTQLRAILRAANYGCIEIVYPMISTKEDLERANNILTQAGQELCERGIPFNKQIKVGVMIRSEER